MRLSYVARSLLFAWALDVCSSDCVPGANFEVGVLRLAGNCAAGRFGWGFECGDLGIWGKYTSKG